MKQSLPFALLLITILFIFSACSPAANLNETGNVPHALAVETFLVDIAQNVAGERMRVDSLMPVDIDPHAFEPAPSDVAKISQSKILIVNGAGLETWLQKVLDNAGGERTVIEASQGLKSRKVVEDPQPGEGSHAQESDPHFWLDPTKVIRYTENIRDGLINDDPAGKDTYTQNAEGYIQKLKDLDTWIEGKVLEIPPEKRLLVTNHESLGYFADRYGFKIVGSVIPSLSTDSSPSAQQIAGLMSKIRATGAPAIFLETGTNPKFDEQIANEAGVKIVTNLYTHSITAPGGKAPTYLDMMKYNTQTIVDSLK